ncbi:MAG TPA: hypothetical protein DCZ95_00630 [Verrucomicrobia bacterium]|nr:MAG: hypothetical protein A2X46_05730 [Lentisphaerae bacterium GWF2_57_35]HBA82575.1 hypothetical protein [Verrucomicrobiota bacterium]
MNARRKSLALVAALALAWISRPLQAQITMQVDGIPGDSMQSGHTNWIDCRMFMQTVIRSGADPASHYITLWKDVDRASPLLHERIAAQSSVPRVVMNLTRLEGGQTLYYEIVFSNVTFTTVRFVLNGVNDVEEIGFLYQMVQWTYYVNPDLPEPSIYADTAVNRTGYVTNDIDQDGLTDIVDPDDDDDRFSDADELIAGTAADDPASFLRVTFIQTSVTNALLEWTSRPGRWYRIHQAGSVDGPYAPSSPALIYSQGDDVTSTEVPISPLAQFYRVTVENL